MLGGARRVFIFVVEDYNLRAPVKMNDNMLNLLGQTLFTDYLLQFSIVGLLLLAASVAAISLRDKS